MSYVVIDFMMIKLKILMIIFILDESVLIFKYDGVSILIVVIKIFFIKGYVFV